MNQINQTNPKIDQVLESAARGPCILCQGPAAMAGSFTPDIAEQFGAEAGKSRKMFYGLCEDFDVIEQILSYTLNIKHITHH